MSFSQCDRLVSRSRLRQVPGSSLNSPMVTSEFWHLYLNIFCYFHYCREKLKIGMNESTAEISAGVSRTLKLCELRTASFTFHRL